MRFFKSALLCITYGVALRFDLQSTWFESIIVILFERISNTFEEQE